MHRAGRRSCAWRGSRRLAKCAIPRYTKIALFTVGDGAQSVPARSLICRASGPIGGATKQAADRIPNAIPGIRMAEPSLSGSVGDYHSQCRSALGPSRLGATSSVRRSLRPCPQKAAPRCSLISSSRTCDYSASGRSALSEGRISLPGNGSGHTRPGNPSGGPLAARRMILARSRKMPSPAVRGIGTRWEATLEQARQSGARRPGVAQWPSRLRGGFAGNHWEGHGSPLDS